MLSRDPIWSSFTTVDFQNYFTREFTFFPKYLERGKGPRGFWKSGKVFCCFCSCTPCSMCFYKEYKDMFVFLVLDLWVQLIVVIVYSSKNITTSRYHRSIDTVVWFLPPFFQNLGTKKTWPLVQKFLDMLIVMDTQQYATQLMESKQKYLECF